ncbi:opacity protein-like surface antigen [Sphingomonas aerophila]|uniref:Opacity protein-like surface antigen n=2 Tax=Sphingomonas aerophila TaxID=1344948 RepID=A0A7W9BH48_9SPHN|nr:opacity protein-like surface antigen [Sphingomonas aerophila]
MPAYAQATSTGTSDDRSAADAAPSEGSGIYVAVGGGLVLSERLRTNAGVSAKLDDGFMGLAAIGGRVGPFRGELEGSYRRASINSATGFGLRAVGRGRVSALSGMANLYLEPSLGLGAIRPYLGGGVGVSRFRARDVGAVGLPVSALPLSIGTVSGSKTVFAYQAMAGLSGPVTDHVTASFGYRYFATPSADLSAPLVGSVRVRGLRSHGIEAGLRFGF